MSDTKKGSDDAENDTPKGEVGGRITRMLSICPHCGARHNVVNDTKGVWICPDCAKPYDPY